MPAGNTRFATSAQTTKLLQRLLPADGGIYFRFAKVYQTFIFVISVSARLGFKCRRLQTAKTLPAISADMTTQQDRLECYEKMSPKWQTLLIATIVLVLVYLYFPHDSWTFYLGVGMCLLLAVLTLTHKKSADPKLTADKKVIRTTYGQTIATNSVTNAELIIKGKWSRHKSHYIKLFFADKSSNEFPVDRLDSSPQDILNILKNIIGGHVNKT